MTKIGNECVPPTAHFVKPENMQVFLYLLCSCAQSDQQPVSEGTHVPGRKGEGEGSTSLDLA